MARVRTVTSEPTDTKRNRRAPEQIVQDLQAEIERVKQRAAAHEARANPDTRALIAAARFLARSAEGCSGDAKRSLEAARAIVGEPLGALGRRVPTRRKRQEAA